MPSRTAQIFMTPRVSSFSWCRRSLPRRADARTDECAVAGTVARARPDRCVGTRAHRGATHRAARREEGHEHQARDRAHAPSLVFVIGIGTFSGNEPVHARGGAVSARRAVLPNSMRWLRG
jgi:hypothetical protein